MLLLHVVLLVLFVAGVWGWFEIKKGWFEIKKLQESVHKVQESNNQEQESIL